MFISSEGRDEEYLVGVISDTHGLLRAEAVKAFTGVSLIIHAGDIGSPEVLYGLRKVAPVVAVRGNVDRGEWADGLPRTEVVQIGTVILYVLHDVYELDLNPAASGVSAVISGHSHRPSTVHRKGVLFLNPGSAGPQRFKLPVTVALLRKRGNSLIPEVIGLGA